MDTEQPTQVLAAENGHAPRLADGIELIGRMEGSGYKDAPYLARRADGQVIQLPALLYLLAEQIDGRRGYEEIAERASEAFKRGIGPDDARFLVEEKLEPLGITAAAGAGPELQKVDPLLALKFRVALVPEGVVRAITTVFRPLYLPPVVLAVLAGLAALDVWLFAVHGIAGSLRDVLYHPVYLLLILGLVILSAGFHECGHATACRYGGATPGVMGAGIYIVWPAFYTDVTDAYRLGKAGRLRTDLGGVYFNSIFILGTAAAYFATGFTPLLLVIPLQHLEIVHQFLPFIRLDGYYIVSDLVGVPDMFARIKPTLRSLVPWLPTDDSVRDLKPWVRVAVTLYVLTVVPLLLLLFALMVINLPRILSTAWDSFFVQLHKLEATSGSGSIAFASLQMAVLVLPVAGIAVTFWRLGTKIGGGGWRATRGRPVLRVAFVTGLSAVATAGGYVLLPNGDYRPIQPAERGTIQGGIKQLEAVAGGRPGLTAARAKELHGAPSLSRRSKHGAGSSTTGTSSTGTGTGTGATSSTVDSTLSSDSLTTATETLDTATRLESTTDTGATSTVGGLGTSTVESGTATDTTGTTGTTGTASTDTTGSTTTTVP